MFAFLPVLLLCVHLLHFKMISGVDLPSVSGGAQAPAPVWENGEMNAAPEAGMFKANATAEENFGGAVVGKSNNWIQERKNTSTGNTHFFFQFNQKT